VIAPGAHVKRGLLTTNYQHALLFGEIMMFLGGRVLQVGDLIGPENADLIVKRLEIHC